MCFYVSQSREMQVAANSVGLCWCCVRREWLIVRRVCWWDPGYSQTCKCEIQLKGKQLIKLYNKGDIISPPLSKTSCHPSLFSIRLHSRPLSQLLQIDLIKYNFVMQFIEKPSGLKRVMSKKHIWFGTNYLISFFYSVFNVSTEQLGAHH